MNDSLGSLSQSSEPIRHAIRRARWFVASFREFLANAEARTGQTFALNESHLMAAFTHWYRAFEAQKAKADDYRLGYVTFSAGLMLRELIRHAPLTLQGRTPGAESGAASDFWPEGYVYVTYCLAVREAVIEEDFLAHADSAPDLGDLRTWWSFRENVFEDDSLAIAFLQLFAGVEPNWTTPSLFNPRDAELRIAASDAAAQIGQDDP